MGETGPALLSDKVQRDTQIADRYRAAAAPESMAVWRQTRRTGSS